MNAQHLRKGLTTMYMPDYGTVQLLHRLRVAELERRQRGQVYEFSEGELRLARWFERIARAVLRRRETPVHLTRYTPVHLNG
jgi:hypothetical protein